MLTNDDMEYSVSSQVGCVYTSDVLLYFIHYTHIAISDVTSNGLYLTIGNIVD